MNLHEGNIKLLVLVGISVMLLLFISFLLIFISTQRRKFRTQKYIQQLHESQQNLLIEAAVRSEESERLRIAEALHDEVGTLLSSSKLHFQEIQLNEDDPHNIPLYTKGQQLMDEAIAQIRGMSHMLHSSILQEFGLFEAIRHFIQRLMDDHLAEATTALDCGYDRTFGENEISIYRIIQELVNNLIKHAKPKKIHISCVNMDNWLVLTIFHNGKGLTQENFEALKFQPNSMGLKLIQNRLILLRGKLIFSSRPDGYFIDIYLPTAGALVDGV
jgi:signal transduction histidine kinase